MSFNVDMEFIKIFSILHHCVMVRNRPLNKTEESQVKGGEMDDRTIMSATPHFLLFLHENMVFYS